jgi:hypothetical protein
MNILLNEWICFGAAVVVYFLKGVGILWFMPGWSIIVLMVLGICNFVVNKPWKS